MMELQKLKTEWLRDPLFRKEYDQLESSFTEARKLIDAQIELMPIAAKAFKSNMNVGSVS
jgi:hypothetical protein